MPPTLNATRERLIPVIEKSHGVKFTHTDLIVAAVARALRQHPAHERQLDRTTAVTLNADVNVALAMAVENAVVTAVIRNADKLPLGAIAKQRKELSERARANKLQPADIAGATFTISNLGMFGVDAFTAIIVPPQAGILAVGAIADRVVAVDGMIGVRPMMTLTLSSDHRLVDGARAAQFLNDVVWHSPTLANGWLDVNLTPARMTPRRSCSRFEPHGSRTQRTRRPRHRRQQRHRQGDRARARRRGRQPRPARAR